MPHNISDEAFENIRRTKLQRWGALKTERAGWFTHWQDITEHLLPRSGRYFITDTQRRSGRHLYNRIFDSTPTRALRVIGAGMMAGATSPARPWFKLQTEDPDLAKNHFVKLWLEDVVERMMRVFQKSNTYRQLHTMYEELAAFGTSVSVVLPDDENVIHHYPLPIGEYALGGDFQGGINTIYRAFRRTVDETVREFGFDNVSPGVQNLYRRNQLDGPVDILHAIEPRRVRNPVFQDRLNMPWESCYLEIGSESGTGGPDSVTGDGARNLLRLGGFERFPALAPRWAVNTGDVYGVSPGMESLGDIRQLQQQQLRKGQVIDYQTQPPLQVPTTLKDNDREFFPGGVSFYDQATPNGGVRTAYEVKLDINALREDIVDVRQRINGTFYVDLFLMLAQVPPGAGRITATEVAERHEEKLLQLGPVLERLHNELLEPLIDITFDQMLMRGLIPPPPPDLEGQELSVEFVSILAQAQQAIGMNSIDRYVGSLLSIAGAKPDLLDKLNTDAWADVSAERLGVDREIVVSNEKANQLREARNRAIAAQEQQAAVAQQAETAQKLSQTPTEGATALTGLLNTVGPAGGV